jgi:ABC-type polar amino acid transport system ATPase subunit
MAALLEVTNLGKSFSPGHPVLEQVDFEIQRGERVCIVGPSGSGKTTCLRCLNLLIEPSVGELRYNGTTVGHWPAPDGQHIDVGKYRSRIGFVFQHFELFPHLTALDNLTLGPVHVLGEKRSTARDRASRLLARVGLAKFGGAYPRTLSGGQKQRVAIARALAMEPDLILFDEPTSALDSEMVGEVLDIMASLARDGMTMVIVTHELRFAREVADRMVVMEGGRILEQGSTEQVFTQPRLTRTRQILGLDPVEKRRTTAN